ncbi:hypothetical protein [Alistipes sp.]|uniref:hypothetical protein n=1 Tax=Alistipes sp. TaxID=1872444 RepID=UPI003AAE4A63
MVQQILDDMRTYFEAKSTMTPEEQALLQRLNDDFFPITSVSREDLKAYGFDTRSVTDAHMCRLAQKMANDYCEQLFWSSFLMTRPSSKKNISAILRLAAGTTAHAMFRNTITSPISRKNRRQTDISSRSVGRNRSRIFSPTSPTTLSIA